MNSRTVLLSIMIILISALAVGCGEKGSSSSGSGSPRQPSVPDAPINVSATCGELITVDWDTEPGRCYNLYWNTTGGVTTSDSVIEDVLPPYEHSGFIYNGTSNYYAVTAVDCSLLTESGLSTEVSAAPNCAVLEVPENVSVTSGVSMIVDWDAVPGLCYNIYWNTSGGVTTSDSKFEDVLPPYEHTGLIYNGTTYYYAVTALDCTLLTESGLSSEVSAVSEGPIGEIANLTASDVEHSGWLGSSVAISGDYAIAGAPLSNSVGTNHGAAYVFYRNQGGADNWGQAKELLASDVQDYDMLGNAVSISGDCAVIGASSKDGAANQDGAAYIFCRNQGGADNWGEVKKLTSSDPKIHGYFGSSVSISGDFVIVGAYYEDGAATSSGAAYVFYRNQGGSDNWGEVARLTASDAQAYDYFGESASISGDYAVVGASYKNSGSNGPGAAYVFFRNQGGADNWGEVKKLTSSDAHVNDGFGISVSLDSGYMVIGASYNATNQLGAAYVFYRDQGGADNWGEVATMTPSDAGLEDKKFGRVVSISGDYAAVGAYLNDGAGISRGAAYVFYCNQGGADNWGEVEKLTASDAEDYDLFGYAVSISGDSIIVGAPFKDGVIDSQGAAYIYVLF